MTIFSRVRDWWLGGDPSDSNWLQDVPVLGPVGSRLPGARGRQQRLRRMVREQTVARDMLVPGWLARELPPGSLVAYVKDGNPKSAGRFRLYDGSWMPAIGGDQGMYRVLYLPEG